MKHLKFRKSILLSTYLFILLPMIVILPLAVISTIYFRNFYVDSLKTQYTVKLESLCNGNETALQSIAKSIRFLGNDDAFLRILPPSFIEGEDQKIVIPIVFTRIGSEYTSNLLIVNVSMSAVLSSMEGGRTNSEIINVVNKQTQDWFDKNGGVDRRVGRDFWSRVALKGTVSFSYMIDETKSFVTA